MIITFWVEFINFFCFNKIIRQSEPEILYAAAFDTTFNAHVVTVSEIMPIPNSSHGDEYSVWLSVGTEQLGDEHDTKTNFSDAAAGRATESLAVG